MRPSLLFASVVLLSACTSMGGMAGGMAGAGALGDPDILRVAMTSNEGEIVTSQPVVGDTRNADVRQFAQDMIAMHTRLNEQGMALDVDPRPNMQAMNMTRQAQGIASELEAAPADRVDVMYLEKQIALHGNTLAMLDHVLIPGARDAELRAYLQAARPMVREHLDRAMRLHHEMMR